MQLSPSPFLRLLPLPPWRTRSTIARPTRPAKIERGRQTGSVTWTEGIKLRAEQRKIKRTEAYLKSDGHLSKSDRRTLTKMQNKAGKDIYAEKHDGCARLVAAPRRQVIHRTSLPPLGLVLVCRRSGVSCSAVLLSTDDAKGEVEIAPPVRHKDAMLATNMNAN